MSINIYLYCITLYCYIFYQYSYSLHYWFLYSWSKIRLQDYVTLSSKSVHLSNTPSEYFKVLNIKFIIFLSLLPKRSYSLKWLCLFVCLFFCLFFLLSFLAWTMSSYKILVDFLNLRTKKIKRWSFAQKCIEMRQFMKVFIGIEKFPILFFHLYSY